MKKVFFAMMAAAMMISCGNKTQQTAQNDAAEVEDSLTGAFTAYDMEGYKLHVYNSNDVMGDASYIIEGKDSLIVMEYPLFKVNAKEFADYIEKLGKPVEIDVTDYHLGGSDKLPLTMPEGMPAFIEGPVYGGMMKQFAEQFGDTMVELPTQKAAEVPFGQTQKWNGIDFRFEHGATSDFPGASIIIGARLISVRCRLATLLLLTLSWQRPRRLSLLVLSTSSAVMAVWLRRLRWSSRLPIWRR